MSKPDERRNRNGAVSSSKEERSIGLIFGRGSVGFGAPHDG